LAVSKLLFASVVSLGLVAAGQVPTLLTQLYDFENASSRVSLRHRVDEASGLAATEDGRVFTHGDERAVVYEVDPVAGTVLKQFSMGVPVLVGDFEGIAIVGERFFLINSQGLLLEFREGAAGESVSFRGVDTGLANRCEVEGLAYDPAMQALVAACKSVPSGDESFIVLYRIRLSDLTVEPEAILVPAVDLQAFGLVDHFAPSGVEVDPQTGSLFLISARQESIIQVTGGRVISGFHLGSDRHPQAEGITVLPNGTLLLADERQQGRAHLTAYSRGPTSR
jgi:uncharacterized protein YjiK